MQSVSTGGELKDSKKVVEEKEDVEMTEAPADAVDVEEEEEEDEKELTGTIAAVVSTIQLIKSTRVLCPQACFLFDVAGQPKPPCCQHGFRVWTFSDLVAYTHANPVAIINTKGMAFWNQLKKDIKELQRNAPVVQVLKK